MLPSFSAQRDPAHLKCAVRWVLTAIFAFGSLRRVALYDVTGCIKDMTECVPNFEFAPQRTFTIGDAARAASPEYVSQHWAKWHLGSFFNDSEAYGGLTSSPTTHGFDRFNSTVEVAPTGSTNCQCKQEWAKDCLFGHNTPLTHCGGGPVTTARDDSARPPYS